MSDTAGVILLAGRIVFAFFFAMAGYRHIVGGADMAGYARGVRFPIPALAPWPAGIWLLAGAVSVGAGIWGDIGALMLIVFLLPAALWFHAFWKAPEDQVQTQTQLFFRNITFIGACIILFAVFAGAGDGLRYTVTQALIDLT
ncbi:MAG TPA: DoxX family protein [Acidimicrobiales bacterium]|nr:DoxX family protein [Acidimicrobiales bacterium]